MITEVAKNIYRFNVDLPQTALKQLNIYVIKAGGRNIVFDTGYNLPETQAQLLAGLSALDLEVADCELVLTHLHSDHTGLAHLFADAGCPVYAGSVDGNLMNAMTGDAYWKHIYALQAAYSDKGTATSREDNPAHNYKLNRPVDFIPLDPGDDFVVGDYQFNVLDLKGHTPGHIGLYEANHHFIFSADTVLDPISPNITYWGDQYPNILGTYIETLRDLRKLNLARMFATHRKIIDNPNERIDEIIHHHLLRLQEILQSMEVDAWYTVEDISSQISWRIKIDSWQNFPPAQRVFALGETMAHLDYLRHSKHVEMKMEDNVYRFRLLNGVIEAV
ncbi:MBL fold metallo-hydrolase [Fundicoccus culcitae]|uniref:MBL fold metallo-hydrolase n=1 Tax=Fundicoccus culcitae TaxID=2969821 RepID=A0ABY5P8Z7_9LACT|nr:MBL fold metallo-hydrolase [Fundicoccus culcitae]UUX35009.1 MBL fold metallo-hydrolase [Fundicoccus culcitae]